MTNNILIVDDNREFINSMIMNFELMGINPSTASSGVEAKKAVSNNKIDICLLDLRLGKENGIDVMREIIKIKNDLKVIIITGHGTIDVAVESLKMGAFDFIQKPVKFSQLIHIVKKANEMVNLNRENTIFKTKLIETQCAFLTCNPETKRLLQKAEKLARGDFPVLITGENGTGKENLADYIHLISDRASKNIIKVNSSAYPESLIDNELFGHNKGAYTGADSDHMGLFEQADGSTLFLDEIGDMPIATQAKLLRVLQNNEIRRIGAKKTLSVNVRVIAATNKDLNIEINKGSFRQDLFFRLNTAIINIPPLRSRPEDIQLLIDHFLKVCRKDKARKIPTIETSAMEFLDSYSWPGNIRELKNTITYALQICEDDVIKCEDLPQAITGCKIAEDSKLPTLEESEKKLIIQTLLYTKNNKKKAAERLNISRSALYRKIENFGISE